MGNGFGRHNRRERALWMGVTTMLLAALLVILVSPTVLAQNQRSDSERYLRMFKQVYEFIENNYVEEVDAEKLIEGAMQGMFDALEDPHSAYLTERDMRGLGDTTAGEFGGVGLNISKQPDRDGKGYIEVVSPIEDTPAHRAGIQSGDLIVEVEGQSTRAMRIDEVVDRLRGEIGTEVAVKIQRGEQHRFDVTLERGSIEVPTVRKDMIPDDIGFLRIIQFTPHTPDRVADAIEYFDDNDYRSMIIDLRSNPGGVLNGVINTADLFFSDGEIVGTSGRSPRENQVFTARSGQKVPDELPIIVLIDGGSASASEILAGALRDRDRAFVIGETTFGKGSVQQVRRIGDGGFRLTMSRYYTPGGVYIDKEGIVPDRTVSSASLSDDELDHFARLREEGRIRAFLQETEDVGEAEIDAFIAELSDDGFELPQQVLRRLIRDEKNRLDGVTMVYDLEYDEVLQEAVEILRAGTFEEELKAVQR